MFEVIFVLTLFLVNGEQRGFDDNGVDTVKDQGSGDAFQCWVPLFFRDLLRVSLGSGRRGAAAFLFIAGGFIGFKVANQKSEIVLAVGDNADAV